MASGFMGYASHRRSVFALDGGWGGRKHSQPWGYQESAHFCHGWPWMWTLAMVTVPGSVDDGHNTDTELPRRHNTAGLTC
jgi:hypothetical protein